MGYTVDTTSMRRAATYARDAESHFKKTLKDLQGVLSDLQSKPFVGGHGKTGAYQDQLSAFDAKFAAVFEEFVNDEVLFTTFLEQFHTRIHKAAGGYDKVEAQNLSSMSGIARTLDDLGGRS